MYSRTLVEKIDNTQSVAKHSHKHKHHMFSNVLCNLETRRRSKGSSLKDEIPLSHLFASYISFHA